MSPNDWAFTGLISSVIRSGSPPIQWCFHYPTLLSSFSSLFSPVLLSIRRGSESPSALWNNNAESVIAPNWKIWSSDHLTVKRRSPEHKMSSCEWSAAVSISVLILVISKQKIKKTKCCWWSHYVSYWLNIRIPSFYRIYIQTWGCLRLERFFPCVSLCLSLSYRREYIGKHSRGENRQN